MSFSLRACSPRRDRKADPIPPRNVPSFMEGAIPDYLEDIADRLRVLAEREPDICLELRRYADDLDRVARDLAARDMRAG